MSRQTQARGRIWLLLLTCAALMSLPLPDWLVPFRPPLASMAIIYWTMMWPRQVNLGSAWLLGLLLDVLQGDTLGQHALTMSLVCFFTLRFYLQIRIFPLWQLTGTVFALLSMEAFVLFWIDGVAGNPQVGLARLSQALTGAVLWPLFMALMDRVRERLESRDRTFA
jgi:rod shape-determining protein MreD